MNIFTILIAIIIILAVVGVAYYFWPRSPQVQSSTASIVSPDLSQNGQNNVEAKTSATLSNPIVILETNKGMITIELYQNDAPKTVANFLKLAGAKYFDGLTFHRVIKGFMIQGGDPNCTLARAQGMCGSGGPGYKFEDELDPAMPSFQQGYKRGVVAMANAGPNTNGSQFFIMHADYALPNDYTIFGKVISGMDAVDAIANSPTDQNDRPKTAVEILSATVK